MSAANASTTLPTHPGFRNAARSYARIYDARSDERLRDVLTYEEAGERYATYFLQTAHPRRLVAANALHVKQSPTLTYGMMGRSPDFVGGYITGAAMQPEAFDGPQNKFGAHVEKFYDYCREYDVFLSHAVAPPQGTRDKTLYQRDAARVPSLSVVAEDDRGVTINGMKMLATSAAFSDEIWIGNILPLAEGHESEVRHLHSSAERAGAEPVVAQALRTLCGERVRQLSLLPF